MEAGAGTSQGKIHRALKSARRLWSLRSHYERRLDWLYSFYQRALLRFPRLPLPGRGRLHPVRLKGMGEPFFVRMGTTDWYVMEEIFIDEVYGPAVRRSIKGVQNVVDLGANTGFSLRLWQMAYPSAHVIAVEPDADNLQMCRRNAMAGKGEDRLSLVQGCVVGRRRPLALDRTGGAWEFRIREANDADEVVEALTLSDLLDRCKMSGPVDLLKCDIEGAEAEVFSDCASWIGRIRNLLIEVHAPYTRQHLIEDLRSGGWAFEIYHSMSCEGGSELLFLQQADDYEPATGLSG